MYRPMMLPILYDNNAPNVELLDFRENVTDLTTYTFTGMCINLGTTRSVAGEGYTTDANTRSRGKSALLMLIHAEDALTVFTVSTAALGGVNGTILTNINAAVLGGCAAVLWPTQLLDAITGTDAVITFSEAITGCAISLLKLSNLGCLQNMVAFNLASTGLLAFGFDVTIAQTEQSALLVGGFTCEGVEGFAIDFSHGVAPDPCAGWQTLYQGSNAEFSYAAVWGYTAQYVGQNSHALAAEPQFLGAGNGVALSLGFV